MDIFGVILLFVMALFGVAAIYGATWSTLRQFKRGDAPPGVKAIK